MLMIILPFVFRKKKKKKKKLPGGLTNKRNIGFDDFLSFVLRICIFAYMCYKVFVVKRIP